MDTNPDPRDVRHGGSVQENLRVDWLTVMAGREPLPASIPWETLRAALRDTGIEMPLLEIADRLRQQGNSLLRDADLIERIAEGGK